MNIAQAEEIYRVIRDFIAFWAIGIKREKITGYFKLDISNGEKRVKIKYNISIKRVMLKKKYEVRGYVKIDIKKSIKNPKDTEIPIKPALKDILINMSYYISAMEGSSSKQLIKFLDKMLKEREKMTYIILPPYIPDFLNRLDDKIIELKDELKEIFEIVKPREIELTIDLTGKKSDLVLGEALGRVIRILCEEYSDLSNWKNIERQLYRHGGIDLKEIKTFLDKWEKGIKEILKISMEYLKIVSKQKKDFVKGFEKGILDESTGRELSQFIDIYLKLISTFFGQNVSGEMCDLLQTHLSLKQYKEDINSMTFEKNKRCIIEKILKKEFKQIEKCVSDLSKEDLLKLSEHLLTSFEIDQENALGIILTILSCKNLDLSFLKPFSGKLIIHEDTLVGSFLYALSKKEEEDPEVIRRAINKLSKHISRFSYSKQIKEFPYNVIVSCSYILLADLEEKIKMKEKADKLRVIARKIMDSKNMP